MSLREIFTISKGTKVIAGITFSVCIAAIVFAVFYYRSLNNAEDPRVLEARRYLAEYDRISSVYNSLETFSLLDSANAVFNKYPDYKNSFEPGVIYNNRCSSLLMTAIYDSTINNFEKAKLLSLALKYCDSSIVVYRQWLDDWGELNDDSISLLISPYMLETDPVFSGFNFDKVFRKRIRDISLAQIETPRRLSVALSNKGTIYRHMLKPDSSLAFYQQALSLWKDNRVAKSNLSVLLGEGPVKASVIESLFPPDKNKK